MGSLFDNAGDIISSASESTLGILGLMILCVSVIALFFFHKEHWKVKGAVFIMLFLGVLVFGYAVTIDRNPIQIQPDDSITLSGQRKGLIPLPDSVLMADMQSELVSHTEALVTTEPESVQTSCGEHWTRWINIGQRVDSPCPSSCERGKEIGQSYRSVGLLPPRPQTKYKFQCWSYE